MISTDLNYENWKLNSPFEGPQWDKSQKQTVSRPLSRVRWMLLLQITFRMKEFNGVPSLEEVSFCCAAWISVIKVCF